MNAGTEGRSSRVARARGITNRRSSDIACLLASVLLGAGTIPETGAQNPSGSAENLAARWSFDQAPSNIVAEHTGRYPGTVSASGVAFVAEGVSGAAVSFTREQNGHIRFGDVLPMLGGASSISLWIRTPPGDATPVAGLITKHVPGSQNGYYIVLNSMGDTVSGYNGLSPFAGATTAINDGLWHHLVLTCEDRGFLKLYVDGAPAKSTVPAASGLASAAELVIGGVDPNQPVGTYNGFIDEAQIYNFSLSESDVEFLRLNPGSTVAPTGLTPIEIAPSGGYFEGPATVRIASSIAGSEIRFTVNGSEPSMRDERYLGPIVVTNQTILRARAFLNGFPATEVNTAEFIPDPVIRVSPRGGLFTNVVHVSLATRLPGVVIRYTLDGSEPVATSALYGAPIRVTEQAVVSARAFFNSFPVSEVVRSEFRRVYALNDGIPADWRLQYFGPGYLTDPRVAVDADPDHDGSNNLQEFTVGSDPLDPLSGFAVAIRTIPEIRFSSRPGQRYRILRRERVEGPDIVIVDELVATAEVTVHVDDSVSRPSGFYVVEPLP